MEDRDHVRVRWTEPVSAEAVPVLKPEIMEELLTQLRGDSRMTMLHLTPELERLNTHYQQFCLHRIAAELSTVPKQAAKKDVSYADFLVE